MQPQCKCQRQAVPFLAGYLCLAAPATGVAQTPRPTVTDEVVVTASRFLEPQSELPIGVTVINAEQIRNSAAATVPELLMQFPGIHVRDNSGSPNWQVDMRGFGITGDQNTLILLDGQRVSENELATVNWMGIPLSSIERIEVMRGSGAVLYGGGATGGTINIITKKAQSSTRSATFGTSTGSYGTYDYRAGVNLAGEKAGLLVNGEHLETSNYRYSNRFRDQNAQADLRYTGERGTAYAKLGSDEQQLLLPGALTEAQIAANRRLAATPGDFANLSSNYANLGGSLYVGAGELAVNAGYRSKDAPSAFFVATAFRNNVSTSVDTWSLTPRAKIPFTLGGVANSLVTGIDWDQWNYNSTTGPSIVSHPVSTQRNSAAYFQNTAQFGEHTLLSLGGRIQRTTFGVTDQFSGFTAASEQQLRAYEFALRRRLAGAWSVYGKIGNSFRVPNINEYFNLFAGTVTLLAPQTSHDRELGAEFRDGRANYRLAVYYMDISNEIHSNPDPATSFLVPNINLPPTRRYGMELEGKWSLSPQLSAFANYTYAVSKFRSGAIGGVSLADKDVPLVPHTLANFGASWELRPRTRLNGAVSYVGQQVFDGDETNTFGRKMPSYTLADLKLTHTAGGWQLSAGVRNLFNQKYFSYGLFTGFPTYIAYPAAERAAFASAQYTFK